MSLPTKKIILQPYNPIWREWFVVIASRIMKSFSHDYLSIEHFGSTAIEGMISKPRIDIVLIVRNNDLEEIVSKLAVLKYKHMGDLGVEGRENFQLTDKKLLEMLPIHNLYLCKANSEELGKIIKFRDKLRQSPNLRKQYAQLKLKLAHKYPEDVNQYAEGKSEFVQRVLNH